MRTTTALLLVCLCAVLSCDALSDRYDRFMKGTEPDRAEPTVPPPPQAPREAPAEPKVAVLAFPGLDLALVERGMMEGWLPGFRRLRTSGTRLQLDARVPASATAAAATFRVGAGTSRHGVLDDWTMDLEGGRPVPAPGACRVRMAPLAELFPRGAPQGFPPALPLLESRLEQRSFLQDCGAGGLRCVVLRCAVGFPALTGGKLKVLGAGALPDLSFGTGAYTFAVEDAALPERRETARGGVILRALPATRGAACDTFLIPVAGPPLLGEGASGRAVATIELRAAPDRARATAITSDHRIEVEAGRWSEPLVLRFAAAPGLDVFGRARLYIRPTGTRRMELYVEPPDFDPARPPAWQALSCPRDWGRELTARTGPLPRLAPAFPGAAFADAVLDARDAAAAVAAQFAAERRLFEWALVQGDYDVLYQSFSLLEDAAAIGPGAAEEIEFLGERVPRQLLLDAATAAADQLVCATLAFVDGGALGRGATVIIYSPYGAKAAMRAVDLNRVLVERGDLVLSGPPERPLWQRIDWSRTRAWSAGGGGIHVNLRGREPAGIVEPAALDAYLAGLAAHLLALQDPVTGARIVLSARRGAELAPGQAGAPDLQVGLAEGCTVSFDAARMLRAGPWLSSISTAAGSGPAGSDPSVVPGLFAMTRRTLMRGSVSLEQVAATIPALLEQDAPPGLAAAPLLIGRPMERAPEEVIRRERKEEPEDGGEEEAREPDEDGGEE
ncbi:MAG: hypothetical protein HY812_03275 [Planctomycetes bacterium]|nr:hypothetical protein [Planctomycetota bacterium]